MARYIDSEQVVRELFSVIRPDGIYGRGFNRGIDLALAIVNRQDTADVVEVCRCKDCKHFAYGVCTNDFALNLSRADDFCSYGERRDT